MRDDSRNPDIVLLAGGGGEVYAEAAREIFPRSRVEVPRDPTLANARGYWFYGE
jgi:plasmid segregation protein ParM